MAMGNMEKVLKDRCGTLEVPTSINICSSTTMHMNRYKESIGFICMTSYHDMVWACIEKHHNMTTGVANIQDIKMIITEAFVYINDTHGHLAVIAKNKSIANTIHLTSYIRNFTEESYPYERVKAEKLLKLHIIKGSTGESTYNETHISTDLTK